MTALECVRVLPGDICVVQTSFSIEDYGIQPGTVILVLDVVDSTRSSFTRTMTVASLLQDGSRHVLHLFPEELLVASRAHLCVHF